MNLPAIVELNALELTGLCLMILCIVMILIVAFTTLNANARALANAHDQLAENMTHLQEIYGDNHIISWKSTRLTQDDIRTVLTISDNNGIVFQEVEVHSQSKLGEAKNKLIDLAKLNKM